MNNHELVKKSILALGRQFASAYREMSKIKLPKTYRQVNKIVVCGMGGSEIGADLIRNLFNNDLKTPIIINSQYDLPDFCDKNTLVILSSYSGGTEETVSCLELATKQKLKVFVMASGGKLIAMAKSRKLPYIIFSTKENPAGQPRLGAGFAIAIFWQLLKKLNLIRLNPLTDKFYIKAIEKAVIKYQTEDNKAEEFAKKLYQKIPIFVASEFLSGNAHVMTNQINESAKSFANFYILPELNHHLLEGLTNPVKSKKDYLFIFLNSSLYHPRNQKRFKLTREILKKQKIASVEIKFTNKTKYEQSAEALVFGAFLSYYSAKIYKVNPLAIPWVNFFKNKLGD